MVEPCRLPRWSPWGEWLESGRCQTRCVWLPRQPLKRCHQPPPPQQREAKRPCWRRQPAPFREVVDVSGYRPDEVRVRLSADGLVTVSACHRQRSDAGFSHSRMVRRVTLPQHVSADGLTWRLTPRGQLILQAPPAPSKRVVLVPVTYDAPAIQEREGKSNQVNEKTENSQLTEKVGVSGKDEPGVPEEPAREDCAELEGRDVDETADVVAVKNAEDTAPVKEADTDIRAEETAGDEAPQSAEVVCAEAGADADGEAPEVVDLEAVPVSVRSGSPTTGSGDSSVLASVDVSGFRPEEVGVRVTGRQLLVEALHEETAADGSSCQLRLVRHIPLP